VSGATPGRIVTCPKCGKPASMGVSNRWRPFCSERCRLIDLGAWATESYRVAGKPPEDDGGAEGSGGQA
jgi:uncharacterized protein